MLWIIFYFFGFCLKKCITFVKINAIENMPRVNRVKKIGNKE